MKLHWRYTASICFLEVLNDVDHTDVSTHDAAEKSEEEDEEVLGHFTLPPAAVAELGPVGGTVDERGGHDGQGRHLHRAQEGHDQVQPRDGGRK